MPTGKASSQTASYAKVRTVSSVLARTTAAAWIAVDLAPGTYGVACVVPDPETHAFHVLLGMAQVVTAG